MFHIHNLSYTERTYNVAHPTGFILPVYGSYKFDIMYLSIYLMCVVARISAYCRFCMHPLSYLQIPTFVVQSYLYSWGGYIE